MQPPGQRSPDAAQMPSQLYLSKFLKNNLGISKPTREERIMSHGKPSPVAWGCLQQLFDHLCELGAELDLRNSNGQTVLHEAVREQNLDRVLSLLMLGACAVVADNAGAHPLHYAVEVGLSSPSTKLTIHPNPNVCFYFESLALQTPC
ncbi:unnamed protein product [Dibothriocephalus latus]|uniref:Uncharacterized protein n=1 Tax=Dibothriocephalus latus TaxID=60516 RepID=A0A3P7LET6_DIBLA|nr:unnamed protein product [Dibothriocephalus latus]